jgi:hypothetical protein
VDDGEGDEVAEERAAVEGGGGGLKADIVAEEQEMASE